jgi:hypothetical protein
MKKKTELSGAENFQAKLIDEVAKKVTKLILEANPESPEGRATIDKVGTPTKGIDGSVSTDGKSLQSLDDVKIRSNAKDITVYVYQVKEKMKTVKIGIGSVVVQALQKASIDVDENSTDDVRVNGVPAKMLQELEDGASIYIAMNVTAPDNPRVHGAQVKSSMRVIDLGAKVLENPVIGRALEELWVTKQWTPDMDEKYKKDKDVIGEIYSTIPWYDIAQALAPLGYMFKGVEKRK